MQGKKEDIRGTSEKWGTQGGDRTQRENRGL